MIRTFMRKKIKIFLFILFIAFAYTEVKAQDFTSEVKATLNLSQMDMPGANTDKTLKPGFSLGVNLNYKFHSGIFFQSGFFMTKKGSRKHEKNSWSDEGDDVYINYEDITSTIDANYIQIPLGIGYEKFIDKNFGFNFSIGGYGGVGFKGKTKVRGTTWNYNKDSGQKGTVNISPKEREDDTFGDRSTLKRFDYGITGNVSIIMSSYIVSLGYEYGLMNVSQNSQEMKNRNLVIGLGMRF